MNVGKVNVNTELRTGVLSTLQQHLSGHRADGENVQGLLGHRNSSARGFTTAALGMRTR
jgi:tagatose 1,6-diphosphate aldolase GatY/KbaY